MIELGKYRHFKGGVYEVIALAAHSETGEDTVVYRALYGDGGTWVRPASMWEETVEVDGAPVRRFTPIAEPEENAHLLDTSAVGTLATLDADGSPYAVPVHFAALDGKVYIHGGAHGRKYENLLRRNRVCFTAWDLRGYTRADNPEPCRTGTSYRSVVLNGTAALVEDAALKRRVLRALAVKYSPEKDADNMPDAAVARTCVVELHGELTEKTRG